MARTVCVVSGGRGDYGHLKPVLRKIEHHSSLSLQLVVTGSHLSATYGETWTEIENDNIAIDARVNMLLSSDTAEATGTAIGLGTVKFASLFEDRDPDMLLVLGDRFDILPPVTAALPRQLPVAHVHGGESTVGVMDEQIRHAVSKMSHLHFPATDLAADRIRQMGEENWRIETTGAPVIEQIRNTNLPSGEELENDLGLDLSGQTGLVIYNPVTLDPGNPADQVDQLLQALDAVELKPIFIRPNADPENSKIVERIDRFVSSNPKARQFTNLSHDRFWGLLSAVDVMAGNSSSGLIEAPCFELPFVNVGSRQKHREAGDNVLRSAVDQMEIEETLQRALDPDFRNSLSGMSNPYERPDSPERIVNRLADVDIDNRLIQKEFKMRTPEQG